METGVKQRLVAFIKTAGLSQARFEKAVGVSNGYVNNISKGIGAEILQRIIRNYPTLNSSWLITGNGEMLNKAEEDVKPKMPCKNEDFQNLLKTFSVQLAQSQDILAQSEANLAKNQELLAKSQEQIDKLLGIISKL